MASRNIPGSPNLPSAPRSIPGTPSKIPGNPASVSLATLASGQLSGGFVGMSWRGLLQIDANLVHYEEKLHQERRQAIDHLAEQMGPWAQSNAPWKDVTGDARRGLRSYAVHDEQHHMSSAVIEHDTSLPYILWLETKDGGKFGIIMPTMLHFAAMLAPELQRRK